MRLNKINFGRTFLEVDDVYSDLYRRFASCFNCLLEPEINDEDYIINCYVESNAETRMVDCINSSTDGIFHLIGYTGIGKTTLLCHLMSTHPNCTVPIIEKSILYLPTFFDSHVSEVNEEITDSISRKFASYCRFLHNTFSPAIVSEKESLNKEPCKCQ